MNCSDINVYYYGKLEKLPEKIYLKAGQLEVVYENGCLRYIKSSGNELVRNIYSAVRDRNWGTIMPVISSERVDESDNSFYIRYKAHYVNSEIDFIADYEIRGTADNVLTFSMRGKAMKSFLKNRIGFCILHPLDGVKGELCRLSHPDNTHSEIRFPELISPHQPATNISAMEWENNAALCSLNFEGDVWEMEDHRNWTDSSFKTYCTPLSVPFPALIEKDSEVIQKVVFKATPKKRDILTAENYKLYPEPGEYALPDIGTAIKAKILTESECRALKKIGLKHLRYDLNFTMPAWQPMFEVAAENSRLLGIPLELILHFSGNVKSELEALQKLLASTMVSIKNAWFIDEKMRLTNNALIHEVLAKLRQTLPGIPLGGGTDAYFAEFNRNRFDASKLDFVTYAVCPQIHAFDNDSLTENMVAQTDTVVSARSLYPGTKIHISPITLKQRFNVVATGKEPPVPDNQLPPQVDERQMSLFAAGYTLGSLSSLSRAGANAVTLYEATGWRGILQGEEVNLKPSLFAGNRGDIFPVYHLLRFFHNQKLQSIKLCKSSHPLKFTGIILQGPDSFLVLANHVCELLRVFPEGIKPLKFLELSKDSIPDAIQNEDFIEVSDWMDVYKDSIVLKPYSVVFVKIG